MQEICLEVLANNISMDNVVDILEMTDVVKAEDLQRAAERFLVNNRKHLTQQVKDDLKIYPKGIEILFKIFGQY